MIEVRRSDECGVTDIGCLNSHHTFSFDSYYGPHHMYFRTLRVIKEDYLKPDNGFTTHHHKDMEIISYVVEGGLEYKDSMGHSSTARTGEIQLMSAGSGITHS